MAAEYQENPTNAKAMIIGLYGGMGSFNDLVLHDENRIPLRNENDELQRLKTDLYNESQGWSEQK